MDIIGYIGTQAPVTGWSTLEKVALLDSLADYFEYDALCPPEVGKKTYVNFKLRETIKTFVNVARKRKAQDTVQYDVLDLD